MKRRIFSLFLALTLVVGMLPAPAFAEETEHVHTTEAPTEAPATEAPAAEPTQPTTEAPKATEAPAPETTAAPAEAQAPTQDEAVTAAQAMIDALPDVDDMSEGYIDALEAAYSAFEALTETQQAQITGVEKLEALFGWVNGQVSTLADDVKEISGDVTWSDKTFTTPVKLTGATTLTLEGTNKIECDAPLDLNGFKLTIKGTGTLEVIGDGRSKEYQCNGAIFDSTYTGRTAGAGTLILEGGTVKASGGTHNAISLYAVDLKGGNLEAYGGVRSGLACSYLYARSGSIYATGGEYGIYAAVHRGAYNLGNLTILASDEKEASPAEMDEGDIDEINDNAKKKTYYIGEVSGPMLSVKAQKGTLYEDTANQTATFAISARNVDTTTLKAQWVGDHTGLTQRLSADGKTLTVTTDATVKQGTYSLTVTVADADGTTVFKTVTVTVSGPPITITTQPKDASVSCKNGDLDSWQGDKEVLVAGTLAEGLTGNISYQWKLGDGTVLEGFTQSTVTLKDLYQYLSGEAKLTKQTDKPWLSTAKVYCTLAYGSYSVDTNTVTLTVNTCAHDLANPDGTCQQCGEPCSQEPMLVHEDGTYIVVQEESGIGPAEVGGFLIGGGTFYLTDNVLSREINAGNTTAGDKDVTLDLQDHTLAWLQMDNFPYGTFTLKNGTLDQCGYSKVGGVLILDGVTFGSGCFQATNYNRLEITVKGNTLFRETVSFNNDYRDIHLQGGTYEKGISARDGEQALAFLDEGFAYQDSDGNIVDASYAGNIDGIKIQVVEHTCDYVNGKCACGRSCDHEGTVDADGYCTFCHALVYPYAIGQTRYTSLEDALTAANAGDTITLRGDFYQGYITEEINKSVTLELGNHTLTGGAEDPVLLVLAEDVTIQNGTVENTNHAKSSLAVTVGKVSSVGELTTKNVTFIGSDNGVNPQGSALHVMSKGQARVESGTYNGGIYVEGNLTMTGGSATILERGFGGTVQLSGGSFGRICFANPPEDYEGLLAKGYAYQVGGEPVEAGSMTDSAKAQVVKCTHPDGLTGDTPCPYCGKTCDHENVSKETGLCPDCGYQVYGAKIGDTLYATAEEALDAAADSQTVKLLADGTLADYKLDKNITLSLDGNTLRGDRLRVTGNVTVSDGGEINVPMEITGGLTLESAASLLGNVTVNGSGSLVMDSAQATAQGITVIGSGSFELRNGSIARLNVASGKATLYSGRIHYSVSVSNGNLQSILADGRALVLMANGNVVDGTQTTAAGKMEIADHTHTFGEDGKCACGVQASIQVEAGEDSFYFGDFEEAVNKAMTLSGSTVRLLADVTHSGSSNIYIDSGTFTIDWNGHTLSGSPWNNLLVISKSANVTLTDSSDNNAGGARNTGLGTAVCVGVDSPGSVKIQGGTYSPNVTRTARCYGKVQISGGVFKNDRNHGSNCALYNESGRPLSDMLADGTAFAYDKDGGELLNAYSTDMSDHYRNVYVVAHTHDFEDGVCDCGYECPHEGWMDDGVCDLCGMVFAASVTKNGVTTGYAELLTAITEICGDKSGTLKLLADVNSTMLSVGYFPMNGTLDLNAKELTANLNCHPEPGLRIVNTADTEATLAGLYVSTAEGGKVTIDDTTGSILFRVLEIDNGSLADLLPEGGAYQKEIGAKPWISAEEAASSKQLSWVRVQEAPVKSVTLTANKDTVTYGESQTVTLTADSTLADAVSARYAWAEVLSDGTVQTFTEEVDTSFTLPEGVSGGVHTYKVSVTADGYTLSKTIEITVTKAEGTLTNKDYPTAFTYGETIPEPKRENFISNNLDGEFRYSWERKQDDGLGTLPAGEVPSNAGTYFLHVEIASDGNYETVRNSFTVTINPLTITSENIVYDLGDDLIYNGKSQSPTFRSITANGKELDYTVTGNTETNAGSYTMTVTGRGNNFTGSVEIDWKILPRDLSKADVTLGDALTYNGREQTQTVDSVTLEGMDSPLTEGKDFQVIANTRTDAGPYSLSIAPVNNNFTGSKDVPWSIAPMDISKATAVRVSHDPLTYNGQPQTPTGVTVVVDGLTATVDVNASPRTNAAMYDMTVTGTGNFTGSRAVNWYIHKKSIENAETIAMDKQLTYNGQEQTQNVVSVTVDYLDATFEVTGNTGTNAGNYTMTIRGTGNFTGTLDAGWNIAPKSLGKATIVLGDDPTYNFGQQTKTVTSVTVDGISGALTEGVDYTVSGNTGTDAGDYTLRVFGKGNFTDGKEIKWAIKPLDITDKVTTILGDGNPDLIYNGKEQTPKITAVRVKVATEEKEITFRVDVTPQVNVGRDYPMAIVATGNFTGRIDGITWEIKPKDMSNAEVVLGESLTYNGSQQTQTITSVTVDGLSVDYTVTGNTGTDAGSYTMTLTGNDNFTGSQEVSWSIARKDIGNAKITLGESLTYNDEEQTQTVASVTVDGLDVPTYTVTGNTGKNANNDYTLTVKADGNFIGTQTAKWSIDPLDISKAATFGVMFDDPTYNGQAQTPDVVSAEVLIGTKLVKITFQVDVTPQVNAGEYKLAIIGTGNYTGRRDGITWKIKPKSIAHAEIVFGPELTYNGEQQTKSITSVTVDGLDVTYSVVGRSNTGTDAEGYALCIEGTGNFTGICFDEFEIARKDVTIGNVTVESTKVYDGTTTANITSVGTLSDNYDGDGLQIVSGTAAYDDKNVGTGKTVTFTGFSLSGDRADNYNLVGQPDPVTADITAKPITLTVSVKDKDFDGTTKAVLDTVTHTDFVAGDDVKLENGEPSFAYPCVRADIPIGFTDFRLTGADAGNYQLTNAQPEGVTAEIHPTPNYLDVTNKPEFDGKTTVTIDGQEYPIEEMGDRRYVNLPETGDLLTIYSFQNGTQEGSYTNYPTGMQVFRITRQEGGAKAEEITELANLLNYVGCSIRITGKKGIRMITAIDQTVKKSLINKKGLAGYTLEEYGTVVQWADSLGSDTLNLDSGKGSYAYKKGKADPVFAKVDGMVQYTNVLVGFSDAQLEPNLVMRPYIKLKDIATGETVTLYGGCVTRSIGYVAWQNRNTYKEGTASYKYVWGIINKIEDTSKYPTN